MNQIFNMTDDLKRGQLGEDFICKVFGYTQLDGGHGDMLKPDGSLVELKTESKVSPNFFAEKYSNIRYQTPGGPWQAAANKAEWYGIFFTRYGRYVEWRTEELLAAIESYIKEYKPNAKQTDSRTHVSEGYALPRNKFTPLGKVYNLAKYCDGFDIRAGVSLYYLGSEKFSFLQTPGIINDKVFEVKKFMRPGYHQHVIK